jgi:hypothetical protein
MKPVVINADPINPTFSVGWLDYAQARGFGTVVRRSGWQVARVGAASVL